MLRRREAVGEPVSEQDILDVFCITREMRLKDWLLLFADRREELVMSATMQAMLDMHRHNGKPVVVLKDEWRKQLDAQVKNGVSEVTRGVLDLGCGRERAHELVAQR